MKTKYSDQRIEQIKQLGFKAKKHGLSKSPTAKTFQAMHWRNNPRNKQDYKYYKNIGVCERWKGKDGFINFVKDMGLRPEGMTLDRIDNNKEYHPDNCRWATRKIQAVNQKTTIIINFENKNYTIEELCLKFGLKKYSVVDIVHTKRVKHLEAINYLLLRKELGITTGTAPKKYRHLFKSAFPSCCK